MTHPQRLISGGQTGADRGALDAAIALGIPHGGWCPRGRLAEDGVIPAPYRLTETAAADYETRTRANVRSADATLIITAGGPLSGGTLHTAEYARALDKPLLHVDLAAAEHDLDTPGQHLRTWLRHHAVRTLNVAGPRESTAPGIHAAVRDFLCQALITAK